MKRKAIEINQPNLIECDNHSCNFTIPNPIGDPNTKTVEYINTACPKCGENLLTEKDYTDHLKLMKAVNWINKWFSWITVFYSKSKGKDYAAKSS